MNRGLLLAQESIAAAKQPHSGTPPGEPKRPRLHELDGLRAVAITLVVLHHSVTGPVSERLSNRGLRHVGDLLFFTTGSGVELFFVLSGIVLLRPYLRGERRFRALRYLRRRFERLWPPYAVALAFAGFVIFLGRLHPTWYSDEVLPQFSAGHWLAQVGIVNFGWPSYNSAWWSLNLEILFYAAVPLVVMALVASRYGSGTTALLVCFSVAASLVTASFSDYSDVFLRVAAVREATEIASFSQVIQALLIYAPCFALGVAIARCHFSARSGILLAAYGGVHCLLGLWQPVINVHLGFAFLYAGVALVAMEGGGQLRRRLSKPVMVWLGERSYSLFLVHFPVFYLISYLASLVLPGRGTAYFLVTRVVGIPLALLAAMTMFSLAERRFARGLVTADRFWPWRVSL